MIPGTNFVSHRAKLYVSNAKVYVPHQTPHEVPRLFDDLALLGVEIPQRLYVDHGPPVNRQIRSAANMLGKRLPHLFVLVEPLAGLGLSQLRMKRFELGDERLVFRQVSRRGRGYLQPSTDEERETRNEQ
jgi:hypothetical protein